jgi:hypothetical protein
MGCASAIAHLLAQELYEKEGDMRQCMRNQPMLHLDRIDVTTLVERSMLSAPLPK